MEVPSDQVNSEHTALPTCKFCQIIRNKETLKIDGPDVVGFADSGPLAKQHFLLCSKGHIKNVDHLNKKHLPILRKMESEAYKLLRANEPKQPVIVVDKEEKTTSKYALVFHRSFATSVDHLHLHAMELPFKSSWAWVKNTYFSTSLAEVIARLEA